MLRSKCLSDVPLCSYVLLFINPFLHEYSLGLPTMNNYIHVDKVSLLYMEQRNNLSSPLV